MKTKLRIFNTYVTSVFMYNSEIWTLTKEQEKRIDSFHRNMLRKMMKIKWPFTISNNELYNRTKETPWSRKIHERRLRWLGHMLRLNEETPVRKALEESLKPARHPPGRPKTTWIGRTNEDLQYIRPDLKINNEALRHLASDREVWRRVIRESAVPTNGE